MRLILLFAILSASCSHHIVRSNYKPHQDKFDYCNVRITKEFSPSANTEKVGTVELEDSRYSIFCNEAHAMKLLKKEACALNADLVHLVNEKRPDALSSCYRCKAEIYKIKNDSLLPLQNEPYTDHQIDKRVKQDKKRNAVFATTAVLIGFFIAYLIVR